MKKLFNIPSVRSTHVYLAILTLVLSGCGGGDSSSGGEGGGDVRVSGRAADGYVSGATVSFNGQTTTTDAGGNYSFTFAQQPDAAVMTVEGGTDTATGEAFEGQLSSFVPAATGSVEAQVTPLTTVVAAEVARQINNGTAVASVDVSAVKTNVAANLGVSAAMLDADILAASESTDQATATAAATAMKQALVIQKAVEAYSKAATGSADSNDIAQASSKIFEKVALTLSQGTGSSNNIASALAASNVASAFIAGSAATTNIADAAAAVESIKTMIDDMDVSDMSGAGALAKIEAKQKAIEVLTKDIEAALVEGNAAEATKKALSSVLIGGVDSTTLLLEAAVQQVGSQSGDIDVEAIQYVLQAKIDAVEDVLTNLVANNIDLATNVDLSELKNAIDSNGEISKAGILNAIDTDGISSTDLQAINSNIDAEIGTINTAPDVTRVSENRAPVITLKGYYTLNVEAGSTYTDAGATVKDDKDASVSFVKTGTVDISTLGTYNVKFNATDSDGKTATEVTRTVNVVDTTAPVITLTGEAESIEIGAAYTEQGASVSDNSGETISAIIAGDTVDVNTLGSYTITYNASDSSGNSATQVTRTVTVVDTTAPVITLTGEAESIEIGAAYTEQGASVSDNSGETISAIIAGDTVDVNTLGSYTITYNASDSSGNSATEVTRTVNVVDNTAPVITLTGEAELTIQMGATYTEQGASVSDNSGETISAIIAGDTVDVNALGSYTITYNASDSSGNSATEVTRTVNVVDNTAPVITLTGEAELTIQMGATYTEQGASVSDNSGETISAIIAGDTVDVNTEGSYTITYNASDSSGNNATQVTRSVTVIDTSDNTAPSIAISGGNSQTHEVGTAFTAPVSSVTDDVDTGLQAAVTGTVDEDTLGDYTLTYTATDAASNVGTATLTVTVVDTVAPTITFDDGPNTATHFFGSAFPHPAATVSDNYDNGLTAVVTGDPADVNTLGDYTLTYTATDTSGNSGTATFIVTVVNTVSGAVVDGYVAGAEVSFCGKTATTDANGNYSITCDTPPAANASNLEVKGGKDTSTGEAFEGQLMAYLEPGSSQLQVTPLTTVVASAIQKEVDGGTNIDRVDIGSIKSQVASNLGVDEDMLDKDLVAASQSSDQATKLKAATALKQALMIQKTVEAYSKSVAGSDDIDAIADTSEIIFEQIAAKLAASGGNLESALAPAQISAGFGDDLASNKITNAETAVNSIKTIIGDMNVDDLVSGNGDIVKRLDAKQKAIEVLTRDIETALISGDAEKANKLAMQSIFAGGIQSIEEDVYTALVNNTASGKELTVDSIASIMGSKFDKADTLIADMVDKGLNLTTDVDYSQVMNSIQADGSIDATTLWGSIDNADFKTNNAMADFAGRFIELNEVEFSSTDFYSQFTDTSKESYVNYFGGKSISTDIAQKAADLLTPKFIGFSDVADDALEITANANFDLDKSITVPASGISSVTDDQQVVVSWQSWDPRVIQVIKRADASVDDTAVVQYANYDQVATLVASLSATYQGKTSYKTKYFTFTVAAGSGVPPTPGSDSSVGSGWGAGWDSGWKFGGGNSNIDRQAPTITIAGGDSKQHRIGTTFNPPSATVTDNVDTGLTATTSGTVNVGEAGSYEIKYSATDKSGNEGKATLTVNVVEAVVADTTDPVITIAGASGPGDHAIEVKLGSSFVEPRSSVTEGLTATITKNDVNMNATGFYTVEYSAEDAAGNKAVAVLTVEVVAFTPPMPPQPNWAPVWPVTQSKVTE